MAVEQTVEEEIVSVLEAEESTEECPAEETASEALSDKKCREEALEQEQNTSECSILLLSEALDTLETAKPLQPDRRIPGFLLLPLIGLLLLALNVPQVFPMSWAWIQTHGTA